MIDSNESQGARLAKLREDLGLGLREAARRSGGAVTHSQISNIENGLTSWAGVKFGTLEGLARAYNVTLTRLLEVATGKTSEVKELPQAQVGKRSIPVYDLVSAGNGSDGGRIVNYMEIDKDKPGERVGYLIEGDSMQPDILPGAEVEVLLTDVAPPGVIIVAYTAEYGMVCKFLQSVTPDGYCILTSSNKEYSPLVIPCDEIHIKGIVEVIRNPAPKPPENLN